MYGMMLARHAKYPDLKSSGLFGQKPLVAFTSEESHYSIVKGANLLGLGVDNVVKVTENLKAFQFASHPLCDDCCNRY